MARLDLTVQTVVKGEQSLKRLSGDLGKAQTGFSSLGSTLAGFVNPATLAVGSALAVGTAMAGAATAALKEEKGIAALTAALKANDPASANHIDQIEQTIREREDLAFADDEQRESLARLVGVTKDTTKALALQRTAMDLARLRGMSLAAASELIGKVYGGNLGILSRYGIQLAKGTTATEALAEIQRRAAGQAEAFADTTSGALQSASIVWDDLTEELGTLLLPVLRDIAIWVRDELVPAFRSLIPVFGAIGDGIGFVADLINNVVNPFGPLLADQKKAAKETDKLIEHQADQWEDYSNVLSSAFEPVQEAAEKIARIPIEEIEGHWDEVRAAAFETTIQQKLGLLDGQNEIKAGMEVLTRLQEEEQTKQQRIAYLSGLLSSQQLASGLKDPRAGVSGAARALRAQIVAELASLGVNAYNSGLSVPRNLAAGMYQDAHLLDGASSYLAAKISGYLPRSNALVGPLSDIMDVGGAIVTSITGEMMSHLSEAERASFAVASALAVSPLTASALGPDVGVPSRASGGLSGPSTGGVTVIINVEGDLKASEDSLPQTMHRAVYVAGLADEYER